MKFDRNVYSGIAEKDFRAGDLNWEQWRAAKEDADSIITPTKLFKDAAKGDFRLKDEALAKRIGFVPFDLADAGVRDAVQSRKR